MCFLRKVWKIQFAYLCFFYVARSFHPSLYSNSTFFYTISPTNLRPPSHVMEKIYLFFLQNLKKNLKIWREKTRKYKSTEIYSTYWYPVLNAMISYDVRRSCCGENFWEYLWRRFYIFHTTIITEVAFFFFMISSEILFTLLWTLFHSPKKKKIGTFFRV